MPQDTQHKIPGALHVADDVISDLIGYAALESYGVVGMAAPNAADGIAKLLPARSLRRGVVIQSGQDGVIVDLYIVIEQGNNLSTVSQNLIDRVRYVLEQDADLKVADINIHVQGVHVQK
jgi:uncharacterized alkaline shock family protein YloU